MSSIEPDELALSECPMIWDSKVSVYHSATATFRAPSNPSGPGGMYREVIRSTPFWPRGDIPGPHRDCIFVHMGDSLENTGMKGLLVARVYLFFKFLYDRVEYPCALVRWYSTSDEPDPDTGLWVVKPESTHQGVRNMSVIHVDSIVRGAHLLPRFCHENAAWFSLNFSFFHSFTSFANLSRSYRELTTFLTSISLKRIAPGIGQEARYRFITVQLHKIP